MGGKEYGVAVQLCLCVREIEKKCETAIENIIIRREMASKRQREGKSFKSS